MDRNPAAFVSIARNRPTRTADYGPAPAWHPRHGLKIGPNRRPARWTRQLRAGSTFAVDAAELEALEAWISANPAAAADVTIRPSAARAPVVFAVALEEAPDAAQALEEDAEAQEQAPKAATARKPGQKAREG